MVKIIKKGGWRMAAFRFGANTMTAAHQLILQTSLNTEYYTDPQIVEAARRVMGGIDLDPASSSIANQTVQAARFFSASEHQITGISDDGLPVYFIHWGGLLEEWHGRVWMNHPFGAPERQCSPNCSKRACQRRGFHLAAPQPGNNHWIQKLVDDYNAGRISQACCITWASTSEAWFQPLYSGLMCFLVPRTGYLLPNGTKKPGATKGSVVTYFGPHWQSFMREFSSLGVFPNHKLLDGPCYNHE